MRNSLKSKNAAFLALSILAAGAKADPAPVETPAVPASVLNETKPRPSDASEFATTPQILKIVPGVNEIIPVAIGHLNRIVTPFDTPHVRTVSQATTQIEGNVLYIATPDETPVTLYITPGETEEVALTLAPRRIPPREIRLTLDAVQYRKLGALQGATGGNGASGGNGGQAGNAPKDYLADLKTIFRALAQMRTPKGYSMREPAPSAGESIYCTQPGLQTRTGQVLEGREMILLVGVARNTGGSSLEFDERSCADERGEVLAVAAWPKVMLELGDSTELYVAVRRKREEETTARPSLLGGNGR